MKRLPTPPLWPDPEPVTIIYDDYDDGPAELREPDCHYCHDEGGDPMNDYCLPCPQCGR